MVKERLLSLFLERWREVKRADGGFFITWRTITYLLVFLGFLALASTGELALGVTLGFVLFWVVGFFTFQRPAFWRDWMGKALVWTILAGILTIALRGKFASVLYLMLFLALYKCFTLREALDHLHALIMSFFMFLACSVITSSLLYMVFMFGFIILMMLDMICLTIAREGARVYAGFGAGLSTSAAGAGGGVPVWRRLFLSSLFVGAIVLVMSLSFFLSIPHYSVYRIPNPWLRPVEEPKAVSGYSDDVNFGNLNQLKLDDTEVMEVFVQWNDGVDRPFPPALRLRGQALDSYSEKRWTTQERRLSRESMKWDVIKFQPLPASSGPQLRQKITNQSIVSLRRLFGAPMASEFRLNPKRHRFVSSNFYQGFQRLDYVEPFKMRLDWYTQSVQLVPMSAWGLSNIPAADYTVISHVSEDAMPFMRALHRASLETSGALALSDPALVKRTGFPYQPDPKLKLSPGEEQINTTLPPSTMTSKLKEIARKMAPGESAPEKIIQLMNWFYTEFEYTLEPDTPYGQHPILAFLTKTHKGHCEYFSTAFVLLLRAQGIPARLATGFYTGEMKEKNGEPYYIVRQSDAHAWAEVWLDGYGWLTFDPTPPDWRGRAVRPESSTSRWATLVSEVKAVWQRYFLDYSEYQQEHLLSLLKNNKLARAALISAQSLIETGKSLLLMRNDGSQLTNRQIYTRLVLLLIAALLAVLLLFKFLSRARQMAREGRQRSPVAFMNQLMQRLQALGWKRAPSQTPAEWISDIEVRTEGRWQLQWVVELYHRCRFANEALTPDEETRLREIIRQLR